LLESVPDGSIDAAIVVFWSGNDFVRQGRGGKGRWNSCEVEAHNSQFPTTQIAVDHGMVTNWSGYFTHRVRIPAGVLKKFRAPAIVGPGSASAWGYSPQSAFDQLARQAIAAFDQATIPVINPPAYERMARPANDIHFENSVDNVRTMTRLRYGATRAAMLASLVRERTIIGLEVSDVDRALWGTATDNP
jgi:hypothetical protein